MPPDVVEQLQESLINCWCLSVTGTLISQNRGVPTPSTLSKYVSSSGLMLDYKNRLRYFAHRTLNFTVAKNLKFGHLRSQFSLSHPSNESELWNKFTKCVRLVNFLTNFCYGLVHKFLRKRQYSNVWKSVESSIGLTHTLPDFAEIWYSGLVDWCINGLVMKAENVWVDDYWQFCHSSLIG